MSHYESNEVEYMNEEQIRTHGETVKKSKRRYYPSNNSQSYIYNAETGVKYPYLVGSKYERLLYKMVDATGKCDKDGYIIKSRDELPNHNTNHLFYDNPEQCMRHLKLTISPEQISKWRERTKLFEA